MSEYFDAGKVAFGIDMRIKPEQMRHWQPERIAQFFCGIAMVLAAVGDCKATPPSDEGAER
jgi:hypothetical protein